MIRRLLGTLLIVIGGLGIILCVLGVVGVWRTAERVEVAAGDNLRLLSSTLDDIDRSLDLADATLDGATIAMSGLYTTTLDVSETLSSTRTTVDEIAQLAQEEVPTSIESSMVALEALEETAELIDRLLRSLTQFGIGNYDPQIPLDEAIGQASEELTPIPGNLRVMGRSLSQTTEGLKDVQTGVQLMADRIVEINENVRAGEEVLETHRATVRQFRDQLDALRRSLDGYIGIATWAVTLLLIWIGLSQLAIIQWGIGLWGPRTVAMGEPLNHDAD